MEKNWCFFCLTYAIWKKRSQSASEITALQKCTHLDYGENYSTLVNLRNGPLQKLNKLKIIKTEDVKNQFKF